MIALDFSRLATVMNKWKDTVLKVMQLFRIGVEGLRNKIFKYEKLDCCSAKQSRLCKASNGDKQRQRMRLCKRANSHTDTILQLHENGKLQTLE